MFEAESYLVPSPLDDISLGWSHSHMSHPTLILCLPMFVEWKVLAEFLSSIGDMSNLVFEMIMIAEIEGLTGSF